MGQIAALSYCVSTSAWIEFGREPELAKLDRRIRKILAINRSACTPLFLSVSLVQASLVRMLLERDSAGDRERAREMFAAALETYAGIAMPRHCDLARGLLAQARAIVPNISAPPTGAIRRRFCKITDAVCATKQFRPDLLTFSLSLCDGASPNLRSSPH